MKDTTELVVIPHALKTQSTLPIKDDLHNFTALTDNKFPASCENYDLRHHV